ncbi:hypothetical protein [Paenibacillus algicola]|nr:hypothetical protein [Paenibacillus algicola]
MIAKIGSGKESILNYVESKFPDILEPLRTVLSDLESRSKHKNSLELAEELEKEGFQERLFLNKLLEMTGILLKPYKDASYLRSLEVSEYRRFIRTVITDVYVDRKYITPKRLIQEYTTDQPEECKRAYAVIRFILNSFYRHNSSFEIVENYMSKRLDLPMDKVEDFIREMEKNRDGLERYFLLEQLSKLNDTLNELAAGVEDDDE